jgi:hypothetical protein
MNGVNTPVGQTIVFRRLPSAGGQNTGQTTKTDGLPHGER